MAADGTAASVAPAAPAGASSFAFPPGSVFTDGHPLPRLVVFDLDYTLWPFWVDTHVASPVRLAGGSDDEPAGRRRKQRPAVPRGGPESQAASGGFQPVSVVDRYGETFSFYGDVPHVLQALPAAGMSMGVASRTSAPELAREVLALLRVPALATTGAAASDSSPPPRRALDVFAAGLEIYPTNKLRHMEALQARTGVPYEAFLFFDDESRNRNVETLGVTMYLVRDGVTWAAVERGVRAWRRRHGHSGGDDGRRRGAKKPRRNSWQDDEDDYEYE